MNYRRALGERGEDIACHYLEEHGYTVIDRNFRTGRGEIDIVARRGEVTVFVEVKSRKSADLGDPLESVTPAKANRIRKVAAEYLSREGVRGEVRFDVIGVMISDRTGASELEHITGAF